MNVMAINSRLAPIVFRNAIKRVTNLQPPQSCNKLLVMCDNNKLEIFLPATRFNQLRHRSRQPVHIVPIKIRSRLIKRKNTTRGAKGLGEREADDERREHLLAGGAAAAPPRCCAP